MPTPLDYMSAIGSPVANVVSNIATNAANASIMRKQMRWQERMAAFSNFYNSPANQRALAIRAGVSPNYAPQGAAGVQSVTSPNMSAPDFSGFKDTASVLRAAALQDEQIKQTKMETYRSGIDSALYLNEKLIKLSQSLADLEHTGLNNEESRVRYQDMKKRYELLEDTYDALVEREELTNRNISSDTARKDEEVKQAWQLVENEVNSLKEMIRHNKVSEAISSFESKTNRLNAVTNRMNAGTYGRQVASVIELNDSQKKRVEQLTKEDWFRTYILDKTTNDEIEMVRLQRQMAEYSLEERRAAAIFAGIKADWANTMDSSFFGNLCRNVFGMNPDEAVQAAMLIGFSANALKRVSFGASSSMKSSFKGYNPSDIKWSRYPSQ